MYLFDNFDHNYYAITNPSDLLAHLDTKDLDYIKHLFKPTYQEQLLQDSLKILQDQGYIQVDGEPVDLNDTIEMFAKYISVRFGLPVYNKMIENFGKDFEYRMKIISNPSMLN